MLLRIEDLDGPRVKPGAIDETVGLLEWLGLDWDKGPVVQSRDIAPCVEAMNKLAGAGLAYPCALSRREIASAASAPNQGDHESRFPPELRPPVQSGPFTGRDTNWRFVTPDVDIVFHDCARGDVSSNVSQRTGDFVLWTKRAQPAYQLAVVVDDHRQGVTQVVRGDDLVDSTARQLLLYQALGWSLPPTHTHLPLVVGPDGRRLAKRHGDSRLTRYKALGVPVERVIGWIASVSGVTTRPQPMSATEFAQRFDLSLLPMAPVVMTQEDDAWLVESRRVNS